MPMSKAPEILLLDTHIWIWYATGVEKAISQKLRALIAKQSAHSAVYISSISLWEIGMLALKNRITFEMPLKKWVYQALAGTRVKVENVSGEVALESALLQDDFHGDPADRILLATSKSIGATLMTRDKEILAYANKHDFNALNI